MSNLRDDKIPQNGDGGGTPVDFGMSYLMDDKIFPIRGCGGLSAPDN